MEESGIRKSEKIKIEGADGIWTVAQWGHFSRFNHINCIIMGISKAYNLFL